MLQNKILSAAFRSPPSSINTPNNPHRRWHTTGGQAGRNRRNTGKLKYVPLNCRVKDRTCVRPITVSKYRPQSATLYHFFATVCLMLPIVRGVSIVRRGDGGGGSYALVFAVGLILGFGCFWGSMTSVRLLGADLGLQTDLHKKRYFAAPVLVSLMWIGLATFLAVWIPIILLRIKTL